MEAKRVGYILYVIQYDACITFYSKILELEILFQNEILTCFDFYGTYLMVEKEDRESYLESEIRSHKNYTCLRVNVTDVRGKAEELKKKNIKVDYQEHDWGTVAKFYDPDGNLLAYKDEAGFIKQVKEYIDVSE